MKKWAIALLALAIASPLYAEEKYNTAGVAGALPIPVAPGQIVISTEFGFDWVTLGGGNGNCHIVINGPGSASLVCPNFGGGGGGLNPPGGPPQLLGYRTTDQIESVTIIGDLELTSAGGPNTYTAIVKSVNGVTGPFMSSVSPVFTGTMSGPTLNLTGTTNPLQFNGVAAGGTCTVGQLMGGLSSTLSPICVTIQSGNGIIITGGVISISAPVSVANGGLGFSAIAPTIGQIPIALNPNNYVPRTPSGDVTMTSAGVFTVIAIGGVPVTGSFAPATNPPGGANNYAPINSPTFTGPITMMSLNLTGDAPSLTFNGVPIGGSCADADSYVNYISTAGVPTCGPALGTIYAPLVNPVGGQNNYAPINSPSFTGTVVINGVPVAPGGGVSSFNGRTGAVTLTAADLNALGGPFLPVNNPTFGPAVIGTLTGPRLNITANAAIAGAATLPDGSSIATAGANNGTAGYIYGYNNVTGLAIGNFRGGGGVQTIGGNMLMLGQTQTPALLLATPGYVPDGAIQYTTGTTGQMWITHNATMNATGQWTAWGNDAEIINFGDQFSTIGANITFFVDNNTSVAQTYTPTPVMSIVGQSLLLPAVNVGVFSSPMWGTDFSPTGIKGAMSVSQGNFVTASGAYNNNNNQWVASNPVALLENLSSDSGNFAFYENSGLTPGGTFTPTIITTITPPQNGGSGITYSTNSNGFGGSVAVVQASNGVYTGSVQVFGLGYSANPAFLANEIAFTGNGADLDVVNFNNPFWIKFWSGGGWQARIGSGSGDGFSGLELGGFAARTNSNNGNTSLSVGNGYMSGTSFAVESISGAAFFNGSAWIADGGAGGGVNLIQGQGICVSFYNAGALPAGAAVPWTEIGAWCGSGMSVDHISNMKNARIPTVSSGVLIEDSRDGFGWVTHVNGGQTTITFAEPFISQSNCSLTGSGTPYSWFNAEQTAEHDTFVCVVPWTGETCPDDVTVEYHCFGQMGKEPAKVL